MHFAVEMCLKALAAHASYRRCGRFEWHDTHNIQCLYGSLPKDLQGVLIDESQKFVLDTVDANQHAAVAVKALGQPPNGIIEQQRYLKWYFKAKAVMDEHNVNALAEPFPGSPEWLLEAVAAATDVVNDRYGPQNAPDRYDQEPLMANYMLGRFFYEHLFPLSAHSRGHP